MRAILAAVSICFAVPLDAVAQSQAGASYTLLAPTLYLGTSGELESEFQSIGAVIRLPTGEVAVGDRRQPIIRVFDRNGRMARSIGRDGEGPGEFRSVHGLFLAADTLIAYDWQLRRLTWFAPDGAVLRTGRLEPTPTDGSVDLADRLPDGQWLVTTPHTPRFDHGHGVYRDTVRVGLLPASATGKVRWLVSLPGMTFYSHMPNQDNTKWQVGFLPVSANTLAKVGDHKVLVGDNSQASLAVWSSSGTPLAPIPLRLPPPGSLRRYRAEGRDRALSEARSAAGREYANATYDIARPLPLYQSFLPGVGGELWLQLFGEDPRGPTPYLVLASNGQVTAQYAFPPRSRVLRVEPQGILVVIEDADGIQRLAAFKRPAR